MKRSTERFLTTHTGSLPRPDDLIRIMFAKEEGVPVDPAALAERVRGAVAEVVAKQVEAGHRYRQRRRDVQAELRHLHQGPARRVRRHGQHLRLSGPRPVPAIWRRACSAIPAARAARRRRCNGPISVRDAAAARPDARHPPAPAAGRPATQAAETLPERRLAGRRLAVLPQRPLQDHEAYLEAIAEAMRQEYEAIVEAGFVLQLDCPDLAMGRHIQFARA